MDRLWMNESDPEKALEYIFDTIAEKWCIKEDPITHERIIKYQIDPNFIPIHTYPSEFTEMSKPKYEEAEDECHPVERNKFARSSQTDLFCSKCGERMVFLQIQCAKCRCMINWGNIVNEAKY